VVLGLYERKEKNGGVAVRRKVEVRERKEKSDLKRVT
jgi:hypothetical protein